MFDIAPLHLALKLALYVSCLGYKKTTIFKCKLNSVHGSVWCWHVISDDCVACLSLMCLCFMLSVSALLHVQPVQISANSKRVISVTVHSLHWKIQHV
jgi:hypothetical protein